MDATSERSEEPRQVVLREVLRTINANPKIKVDLLKTEYPIIRSVATCCFQYRMWCRNGSPPLMQNPKKRPASSGRIPTSPKKP